MATVASLNPNTSSELLFQLSSISVSAGSANELLGEMAAVAARLTGCDWCLLYSCEGGSGGLSLRASSPAPAPGIGDFRLSPEHANIIAVGAGARSDSRLHGLSGLPQDSFEAFASAPLPCQGRIEGVLNLHHPATRQFTDEQVKLLRFMGEQVGQVLARIRHQAEAARLQEQLEDLRRQLETRKVVERAKGLLQTRFRLTEEEAYLRLRNESRRLRRPMKELAEAIILAEDVSRKTDPRLETPAGD